MDICTLCGSTLIKGVCPHCGRMEERNDTVNLYQCRSKAAVALDKRQWDDAQIWVLKGYEQDPYDKELRIAELLALTEGLRKVPDLPEAEARVKEIFKDLGKTVRFRFVTYDLESYRRLLRSHELANTTVHWWEYLIGLLVILCLIAVIRWAFRSSLIFWGVLAVAFFGWLFKSN